MSLILGNNFECLPELDEFLHTLLVFQRSKFAFWTLLEEAYRAQYSDVDHRWAVWIATIKWSSMPSLIPSEFQVSSTPFCLHSKGTTWCQDSTWLSGHLCGHEDMREPNHRGLQAMSLPEQTSYGAASSIHLTPLREDLMKRRLMKGNEAVRPR